MKSRVSSVKLLFLLLNNHLLLRDLVMLVRMNLFLQSLNLQLEFFYSRPFLFKFGPLDFVLSNNGLQAIMTFDLNSHVCERALLAFDHVVLAAILQMSL